MPCSRNDEEASNFLSFVEMAANWPEYSSLVCDIPWERRNGFTAGAFDDFCKAENLFTKWCVVSRSASLEMCRRFSHMTCS